MDRPSDPPDPAGATAAAGPVAAAEPIAPRQRWRLALARLPGAPALAGTELAGAWEAALEKSALPLVRVGRGPARIAFGASLPAAMAAEHELAEILLSGRYPVWRVRESLAGALPDGWRLVDIEDVWLAAPSLTGLVAAADYRIVLGAGSGAATVAAAAAALLRASRLPRERPKGNGVVAYDLRPLLVDVAVADPGPPVVIRARTRLHPSLGSGRPEEVVAALADEAGTPLVAASIVRERIVLADELE